MIREIIQINSFSTFIFGIILNTLLICLVLNKSAPEMKVFSHILLQTALTDLFMLFINVLTQPIFTFDDGICIVVLNSPFNLMIIPQDIMLSFWDNCLFFSIFSQSAQFIYRYLSLNRNINISSFQYFLSMFGIVLPLNFILSFMLYITGKPQKNDEFCCHNLVLIEILGGNVTEPLSYAQKENNHFYLFIWLVISLFVLIAYIIMLVSARAMCQHVRLRLKVDTDRFYEINQQLTLNIITYLLLPLLTLIPIWITFIFTFTNFFIKLSSNTLILQFIILIRLLIPWIAIFNPIVTILTLKHYRKAFISLIFNTSGSDSVVPLNTFTMGIQRNNNTNTR